jgi:acetoacetate decarboxylase
VSKGFGDETTIECARDCPAPIYVCRCFEIVSDTLVIADLTLALGKVVDDYLA